MKPEQRSQVLLGITRSKGKMFEYDIPDGYHIKVTQDPSRLFTLAIGILGELAAHQDGHAKEDVQFDELKGSLEFSARFFDAYIQAKFDRNLDFYLLLLAAASFYLCDLPGSATVLARRIGSASGNPGGQGFEEFLRWLLQNDLRIPFESNGGSFAGTLAGISRALTQFFTDGTGHDELFKQCDQLRRAVASTGTPRQLLLSDVLRSIVRKKHLNSTWRSLPEYTDLPQNQWLPVLKKETFIRELWPAQHLIGRAGVLRGKSAVVQMPTSAGKTRATELIIRSAFLSGRTSLAVIVAPFRALCHEIKNSFVEAFRDEAVNIDELTDVMQGDFEIAELLSSKQILVVTPEKFVYVLRHNPELAANIGLLVFDEGHQFDSGTRGITYELLITSLNSMLPQNVQKVLISAVISNAQALGEWLNGPDSETVVGTGLIPTFRTVAFASWTDQLGRLQFVAEHDADSDEFFVPRVIEQLPLGRKPKERKERVFPAKDDGKAVALSLGFKLVKNGAVAIFCGRKTTAAKLCEMCVDIFDRKVALRPPSVYSDADEIRKLHYLHAQNLGAEAAATRAAQIGVFSHHGNTPHGIRLAVEHAMREGLTRLVVCTSTLAQGVNLPIRYLLVTSVYQGGERIKVRDFHNLIGRAGRAGMHTEGSILFADPEVYDKRKDADGLWKWNQFKQLLEPANSEPCISTLLSFFDPLKSDSQNFVLKLDALDFVNRYVEDPASLTRLADAVAAEHSEEGFTKSGLYAQISRKVAMISAVESFLLSHWDAGETPLNTEQVVGLAQGTLAYFLAGDEEKARIVTLFTTLADNLSQTVVDPERRKIYGKTLFGLTRSQEIESWVRANAAKLVACQTPAERLDLFWPLLESQVQNETFRKCTKPDALKAMTQMWISGQPFNLILGALNAQEARLKWGTKFRRLNMEHVVEMCEGGLAYDGSLLVGAAIELLSFAAPNESIPLTPPLQHLQKMLKYGLPTQSTIALFEAGFSDRVIASDLAVLLKLNDEQRREVIQRLRAEQPSVNQALRKYPSYFTHVMNDVL